MLLDKHHPVYMAWCNMKSRCNNPKSTQYKWYGARGITYCEHWQIFTNFYDDMISTWDHGLSLDRIDNDGDYCKDNCRWTDKKTQSQNRRDYTLPTHCHRGHEFTDDNVIYYKDGSRTCVICRGISKENNKDNRNANRRALRAARKILGIPNGR